MFIEKSEQCKTPPHNQGMPIQLPDVFRPFLSINTKKYLDPEPIASSSALALASPKALGAS